MEKEKGSIDHISSADANEVEAFQNVDEGTHHRVLRKMDWHILPFISLLYLLSFL
jgi:hypothetical protein